MQLQLIPEIAKVTTDRETVMTIANKILGKNNDMTEGIFNPMGIFIRDLEYTFNYNKLVEKVLDKLFGHDIARNISSFYQKKTTIIDLYQGTNYGLYWTTQCSRNGFHCKSQCCCGYLDKLSMGRPNFPLPFLLNNYIKYLLEDGYQYVIGSHYNNKDNIISGIDCLTSSLNTKQIH